MAFLQIITDNILPLLIFVVIGYLMDRKFTLDVTSLTKLTFYVVLPAFIFYSIYIAEIDLTLFNVFLFCCVQMALLAAIAFAVGKMRGFPPGKIEALKNGTMFSNNGNIGIALIALIFTNPPYVTESGTPYLAEALAASTLTLVQMNMTLNTLGLYQAGKGRLSPRDTLRVIFHMPVLYTLAAVFFVKYTGLDMTATPLWPILENCASALVAIVMMALGMQIHRSRIVFGDADAWIGCFIRLVVGPVLCYLLILLWDLTGSGCSPVVAQTLLIMSSVPAAVNSVLYAVEFKNYEDYATELVMMSTFLSCITMTVAIYAARVLFPI